MAHNLMFDNVAGKHAMFSEKAAWHKLGLTTGQVLTWSEAMNAALLNWEVMKVQFNNPFDQMPIDDYGMFRVDTKQYLGSVGAQYTPIQNEYAFTFVDTLLEACGNAHYVSAGALGHGERIWCLAKVNGTFGIQGTQGDEHETYLLFETSHDGSKAATCKLTTVRVVCQNTLTMALQGSGTTLRVKHTMNAESKLEQARKLMQGVGVQIKDLEAKLNALASRKVTKESYMAIMKRLFGDWEEKSKEGKATTRIEGKIAEITKLFDSNDKNTFPEIRGTAYNLLNAITEYTDHYAAFRRTEGKIDRTDDQLRAESALFGTGSDLKEEAFKVIYDVVMTDGSIQPMARTEYHTKMGNGSMLDSIIDATTPNN
jgi:phage/plasmid-like protein (TIGR03299 family)